VKYCHTELYLHPISYIEKVSYILRWVTLSVSCYKLFKLFFTQISLNLIKFVILSKHTNINKNKHIIKIYSMLNLMKLI
jgi:hypothetical protein